MNARPAPADTDRASGLDDRERLDPLDLMGIGATLARVAAGRFGDAALLHGFDGPFFRAFEATVEGGAVSPVELASASLAARSHVPRAAQATAGRPRLIASLGPADVRADPYLAALSFAGVGSAVLLPLSFGERVYAVLTLVRHRSAPPFELGDLDDWLDLADDWCERVATAVRHEAMLESFAHRRAAPRPSATGADENARSEFFHLAAHELRTPLTSVQLQAAALQRLVRRQGADLPLELIEKKASAISVSVHRMSQLITDLVEISRITAGRFSLQREEFDLAALVTHVAERCRPDAAAAGSELLLRLGDGPCLGRWDRHRLDVLLSNLFGNALRSGAGSPVHVELQRERDGVRLVVRDRGPGFTRAEQERLARPFERPDPEALGTFGIGLWIIRHIVAAHGGRLSLESRPGDGSTFTASLPWGR